MKIKVGRYTWNSEKCILLKLLIYLGIIITIIAILIVLYFVMLLIYYALLPYSTIG